jgi:hypothetical protein
MKKIKIVFILSLFFTFLNAYSQQREETHIFGQVIDKITQKPLSNINIVVNGTSI